MAHNALLAGGLLLLMVLVLAHLQPTEILTPSRRTQVLVGVTGGVVSALVLVVLNLNAPELGVVAYPTATAFMTLYFGPIAAVITAALALLAMVWSEGAVWLAGLATLVGAAALGALWRTVDTRPGANPWLAIAGMAVTLPPVVSLCLVATGGAPLPGPAIDWLRQLPW